MTMAKASNTGFDISSLVLPAGALLLLYFGVIRPLTNKLGLTQSAEDREREREIDQAIGADGWNPTFYNTYMRLPANAGKVFCLKRSADLDALAKRIYNAWGTFNDDESAIYAVFRELRSQLQLSQLCERYAKNYNTDLLTRLKNSWFKWDDGLEPQEFIEIAKIVKALPVNVSTC